MNDTNFYHAILATIFQGVVSIVMIILGSTIVSAFISGGLFAIGFYFGREVTQHEKKIGTPPWYNGFKIWEWSLDSKLDLLFPIVATCLVILLAYFTG